MFNKYGCKEWEILFRLAPIRTTAYLNYGGTFRKQGNGKFESGIKFFVYNPMGYWDNSGCCLEFSYAGSTTNKWCYRNLGLAIAWNLDMLSIYFNLWKWSFRIDFHIGKNWIQTWADGSKHWGRKWVSFNLSRYDGI